MLLKHLMKVFNALRNYLVESIGYDNDAQHCSAPAYACLSQFQLIGRYFNPNSFVCISTIFSANKSSKTD